MAVISSGIRPFGLSLWALQVIRTSSIPPFLWLHGYGSSIGLNAHIPLGTFTIPLVCASVDGFWTMFSFCSFSLGLFLPIMDEYWVQDDIMLLNSCGCQEHNIIVINVLWLSQKLYIVTCERKNILVRLVSFLYFMFTKFIRLSLTPSVVKSDQNQKQSHVGLRKSQKPPKNNFHGLFLVCEICFGIGLIFKN